MFEFHNIKVAIKEHAMLPIVRIEGETIERSESTLMFVMIDLAEEAEKNGGKSMDAREEIKGSIKKGTVNITTQWFFPTMKQREKFLNWAQKRFS